VEAGSRSAQLPDEFSTGRLGRRALGVAALIAVLVLVAWLAPGLGGVRDRLADADPGWLAVGVALEALSCLSYVVMFRQVFCRSMSWRSSWEIGWSELAVGSIVPASGAGGLAFGAWILNRRGMPAERIARRSVAFFLVKSSVNFVAVAVLGVLMFAGLGPHQSPLLTLLPAALSVAVIAGVLLLPRVGVGERPDEDTARVRRWLAHAWRAVVAGSAEAVELVRGGDLVLIGGSIGYWLFDNAVLWATFHAVGVSPPVTVILMGYLIGQLGGALPLPGGVGGIDGGLIGTLIVYGTPAAATAAAVLAYRVILFWLPLIVGGVSFASLRRELGRDEPRRDLCVPQAANAEMTSRTPSMPVNAGGQSSVAS
jgi:uncharacterized protein (TIRG00374 family)